MDSTSSIGGAGGYKGPGRYGRYWGMVYRRERVRIETQRHEIEGTLQLPHEGYRSRTTDFLNAHDREFLAVTDADVRPLDGDRPAERHPFLALAVGQIVLVVELGSLGLCDETGEPPGRAPLAALSSPPPA